MHYKVLCRQCSRVMEECRCPSESKIIRYSVCSECQKALEKVSSELRGDCLLRLNRSECAMLYDFIVDYGSEVDSAETKDLLCKLLYTLEDFID